MRFLSVILSLCVATAAFAQNAVRLGTEAIEIFPGQFLVSDTSVPTSPAPPVVWAPTNLPGCQGWFALSDVSTLTTNALGLIEEIANKSGINTNSLTQTDSGARPEFLADIATFGTNNVADFDGVTTYMEARGNGDDPWFTTNQMSVVVVFNEQGNPSGYHNLFICALKGGAAGSFMQNYWTSGGSINLNMLNSSLDTGTGVNPDTNALYTISTKSLTGADIFVNGTQYGPKSGAQALNKSFTLGSWGPNYFRGRIAEVVIYNRSLATNEVAELDTYLQDKFGITP